VVEKVNEKVHPAIRTAATVLIPKPVKAAGAEVVSRILEGVTVKIIIEETKIGLKQRADQAEAENMERWAANPVAEQNRQNQLGYVDSFPVINHDGFLVTPNPSLEGVKPVPRPEPTTQQLQENLFELGQLGWGSWRG